MTTSISHKLRKLRAKLRGMLKSWTIWINGLLAAAPAALDYASMQLPLLNAYLPPNLYSWAFGAVIAANIALRFKTTKPLEEK